MKKKYIGGACILFGIGIMLFPFLKEKYEDHRQAEILAEWEAELSRLGTGETDSGGTTGTEKEETDKAEAGEADYTADPEMEALNLSGKEVAGILKIPKIDLEQPVLKGATESNLNLSAATVEPTGEPGAEGNFAVAGHNSRTYGRHFNRLSELEEGDEVIVATKEADYIYEVTDSYVVEADEVWVLEDTLDGAEITLITCYYPTQGDVQRLVVKGLIQKEEK